jgi:hypothetical protein
MDIDLPASAESDPLPENYHYRDEGCELASSCLNCPFPQCVLEETGGIRKFLKEQRNNEIISLYNNEKKDVKELAVIFQLSVRTIQRALANRRQAHLSTTRKETNDK